MLSREKFWLFDSVDEHNAESSDSGAVTWIHTDWFVSGAVDQQQLGPQRLLHVTEYVHLLSVIALNGNGKLGWCSHLNRHQ